MKKGKVFIGTSGWHYKHWKGTFYPADLPEKDQLNEYLKTFSTVELNNSFYRLPPPATFAAWREATPKRFLFAVKASRFFTHAKKLIVDAQGLKRFMANVDALEGKLGPILFQLPPRWRINAERLAGFIAALPKAYRYTFEFREPTWYHADIYTILRKANCAFCIYELERHLSPFEVTADFVYVRLHGPGNKYQGSYSENTLREWADRTNAWRKRGLDVYIYFDNDQEGYAAHNARTLLQML